MTFAQFIDKYLGKAVDYDGRYGGQCVDLFRRYNKDVLELPVQPAGVNGAADFWTNYKKDPVLSGEFEQIPNTPRGVPLYGDVIIWNREKGGGFGHVALFIVGDTLRFTSLDQNWPALSVVTKTAHDYAHVLGWLRPKARHKILGDYPARPE
jgi:hypothetical protein